MTSQMTFDSFDDLKANVLRMADAFMPDAFTALPAEDPVMPEPEEPERTVPVMPEPEALADTEEPKAEEPKAPELNLTQMRKILSAVNKHTGKNTARELVQAMGYKVLTEMPADKYPELRSKAEEVLNAD